MSTSKNINSYRDIRHYFQLAVARRSIQLEFESVKATYREVARLNAFRVLLRNEAAARGLPATCEFDDIIVRHEKPGGKPSNKITLERRTISAVSIRDTDSGEVLSTPGLDFEAPAQLSLDEEDFLAQALADAAAGHKTRLLE